MIYLRDSAAGIIKMRIFTKVILMAVVLLSASCSGKKDSPFVPGAKTVVHEKPAYSGTLSPVGLIESDGLMGTIGLTAKVGNVLILPISGDFKYRAFNLESKTALFDFLMSGRGPDEDTGYLFSQSICEDDSSYMDVLGLNTNKIYRLDLKKTIEERTAVVADRYPLPAFAGPALVVGDNVVSTVFFDEDICSLKIRAINDTLLSKTVPLFGAKPDITSVYPLFASVQRQRPDGSKIAIAMTRMDKIHLYDMVGDNHITIKTSPTILTEAEMVRKAQKEMSMYFFPCYPYIEVTDEAIYALHQSDDPEKGTHPTLRVFDWEGNYLAEYQLNEPITRILCRDKESMIYGHSLYTENIYIYQLPTL